MQQQRLHLLLVCGLTTHFTNRLPIQTTEWKTHHSLNGQTLELRFKIRLPIILDRLIQGHLG